LTQERGARARANLRQDGPLQRAQPSESLDGGWGSGEKDADSMANRALWNVRKRHEWLATPLKTKRVKRAQRLRCGLQDALDRKAGTEPPTEG
jgi:hypothetical protein